jgi:glycosyltransferase involved in cell wall biosynthesis
MVGGPPKSVALATHYWALGCALALKDYLRPRSSTLFFIGHPTFPGEKPSVFESYVDGNLANRSEARGPRGLIRYLQEIVHTVRSITRQRRTYDVFVAGDSLLALAGLYLRIRGRARIVVLYSVDFVPRRFPNWFANRTYHLLDRFAVRHVDIVWNVTDEIWTARSLRDGNKKTAPQIVVPVGANFARISRRPINDASGRRIVFLGYLLEKQGVQVAIEAMSTIRRSFRDASLLIIGDGPFMPDLKALAEGADGSSVEFAGVIIEDARIEELVSSSALGLAMFRPDPQNFSQFADPGKIKTYLACGIPVIMTDVPPIARRIQAEGAGRVIPYAAQALAETVMAYFNSPELMVSARAAAVKFAARFTWDSVFDDAWALTHMRLKSSYT